MNRYFQYYMCNEETQKTYNEIICWITDNINIKDDEKIKNCFKNILNAKYRGYFMNSELKMELFEIFVKKYIYKQRYCKNFIPNKDYFEHYEYFEQIIICFNNYNNIELPKHLHLITDEDKYNIQKMHKLIYEQEECDYPILK